jgi:hypothetical protein
MEKQSENGKNINAECSQKFLPILRRRLGESAHKLLSYDLSSCKDGLDTLQNKVKMSGCFFPDFSYNC